MLCVRVCVCGGGGGGAVATIKGRALQDSAVAWQKRGEVVSQARRPPTRKTRVEVWSRLGELYSRIANWEHSTAAPQKQS